MSQSIPSSSAERPVSQVTVRTIHKPAHRHWVNLLPTWIMDDDAFANLKAGPRHTLEGIAHGCNKADAAGNLMGGLGGKALLAKIGGAPSTFWTHITKLIKLGFIVQVNRGSGRFANVYSIPGTRGALDQMKVKRRRKPNGIGGAPATKFDLKTGSVRRPENGRHPSRIGTAPVQKLDATRPESGHFHPLSPSSYPSSKPSTAPPSESGSGADTDHVTRAESEDQKSQALLAHYESAWANAFPAGHGHGPCKVIPSDNRHIETLLRRADFDLNEAKRIIDCYLKDKDNLALEKNHSLKLLMIRIGRYDPKPERQNTTPRTPRPNVMPADTGNITLLDYVESTIAGHEPTAIAIDPHERQLTAVIGTDAEWAELPY